MRLYRLSPEPGTGASGGNCRFAVNYFLGETEKRQQFAHRGRADRGDVLLAPTALV